MVLVAATAVAAGCGGARRADTNPPKIPRSVAAELASRSERLASTLAKGDRCAAAGQAAELRQAAHSEVDAGKVPVRFRARLLGAVDSLASSLPACPPPSGQHDEGGNEGRGKHKGKEKKREKGGD